MRLTDNHTKTDIYIIELFHLYVLYYNTLYQWIEKKPTDINIIVVLANLYLW